METVGVGILVTTTTHQAGWTGLVAAAAFVPNAFLGPVGGALADRLPRRRVLLATTTVQTVLAGTLTLLAATDSAHPGVVALIVLGAGCAMAIGVPSYMALLPDLVPRDDLPGAVALSSAQWNLGRVIGPALAGVVIGVGAYEWAFGFNTVSFLAVIAVVLSLRLPPPAPVQETSIFASIRAGARFARSDPGLRVVIAYMALNSLLAAPFIALVPAVALKVFDSGDYGTSLLVTAQGVGAVLMGLALGPLFARFGGRRVLLGVLGGLPLALVAYAAAPKSGRRRGDDLRRRLPLPRRAVELHDHRPAAGARRAARSRSQPPDGAARDAVPAGERPAGRDRGPGRPPRYDRRRRDPPGRITAARPGAAARARRRARRTARVRCGG